MSKCMMMMEIKGMNGEIDCFLLKNNMESRTIGLNRISKRKLGCKYLVLLPMRN
mgnify:CR=1 FL=1